VRGVGRELNLARQRGLEAVERAIEHHGQQRRVDAIMASLPADRSKDYYAGMLFGYRQAVIGIYQDVDTFAKESEVWDITTVTALAIERKMLECK
jgi:hypothetical protein